MRSERFACATLKDFGEIKELYRSGSGAVYRARFRYDSCLYVLKERKVSEMGRKKDIMNEVRLLAQVDHPNVIKCEGWFNDEERRSLFIILEYCNCGDLSKKIASRKVTSRPKFFPERYIWFMFHQICLGVQHLHYNGIVHRDLKPLNIMLARKDCQIKLADLGVSRQVSNNTTILQTVIGTPLYLSPELVDNLPYNEKTDIWSLGVILYELCTLRVPFQAKNVLGLAQLIRQGVYEPISHEYSKALDRCICWMLTVEQSRRPSINQLVGFVESKLTKRYRGEDIAAEHLANLTPGDMNPHDADTESDEEDKKTRGEQGIKTCDSDADTDGSEEDDEKEAFETTIRQRRRERRIRDATSPIRGKGKGKVAPSVDEVGRTRPVHIQGGNHPLQEEEDEIENAVPAPNIVRIDIARLQAVLRKEQLKLRRLRKLKQFFTCSDENDSSKGIGRASNNSDLDEKILDSSTKVVILENAIALGGDMLRDNIERFDMLQMAMVKKSDHVDDGISSPQGVALAEEGKDGTCRGEGADARKPVHAVKSSKEDYEPIGALQRMSNMQYDPFEVTSKDLFKTKKLAHDLFNHGVLSPGRGPRQRPSTTASCSSRRDAQDKSTKSDGPLDNKELPPSPARRRNILDAYQPDHNYSNMAPNSTSPSDMHSPKQKEMRASRRRNFVDEFSSEEKDDILPGVSMASHVAQAKAYAAEAKAKRESDAAAEKKWEAKLDSLMTTMESKITSLEKAVHKAVEKAGNNSVSSFARPHTSSTSRHAAAGQPPGQRQQPLDIFSEDTRTMTQMKKTSSRRKGRTTYNIITGELEET